MILTQRAALILQFRNVFLCNSAARKKGRRRVFRATSQTHDIPSESTDQIRIGIIFCVRWWWCRCNCAGSAVVNTRFNNCH
jgi:hypothetical protein